MSTPRAELVKLTKKTNQAQIQRVSGSNTNFGTKSNDSDLCIEGINNTGERLDPYTCVILMPNADPNLPPLIEFVGQSEEPDNEECLIGSVNETVLDGEMGHVKVSGDTLYKFAFGTDFKTVGARIYPCMYEVGGANNGKVSTKENDVDVYDEIVLGRMLEDEESDSELTRVGSGLGGGAGGGAQLTCRTFIDDIDNFEAAEVDGITLVEGDLVLIAVDDILGDGIWEVQADLSWELQTLITDMDDGAIVTIWDGDQAPIIYVKCVDQLL